MKPFTLLKYVLTGVAFSSFCFLSGCDNQTSGEKKVGIIVPIEHKAMNEIVAGFTETLNQDYGQPIKYKIANAQGDLNLQNSIIQQMKDEGYDVIVPIGTATTQMTLSAIHNQPIVSLAALYSEQDRAKQKPCNITVVHDEISPAQIVAFVHMVYPNIKKLTLIHSPTEKIYTDVNVAVAAGKQYGIEIKPMMVPTLNELYSAVNDIPSDSQGILVLKDVMIVSGISTLSQSAAKKHLPLITSDQGSVQDGAAFALGVHEREIGVEGAQLADAVLKGKDACSIPMIDMTKLTVFVNKANLSNENQPLADIQAAAEKNHYKLEFVTAGT